MCQGTQKGYMQYLASLTACLSISVCGLYIAWASPTLPILTSGNSPLDKPLTDDEGSWVVSLLNLSTVCTLPLVFLLVERFGRKLCLLVSALPMFTGWLVIIFAKKSLDLYAARFIAGVGVGICNITSSIYIAEIAEKDIRGKLSTAYTLLKLLGYVVVLCIGPYVSYGTLNIICAFGPIIFFLSFFNMPESPYFLIRNGRMEEARKNLTRLCPPSEIEGKIEEIESFLAQELKDKIPFWAIFTKEYRFTLVMIICIKTLQQMSGTTAVDSYFQTIISQSESGFSPEISSIIYGVIQIPSVLLSATIVDKMGRKPILIISALGCALSLISEGIYFYRKHKSLDVSGLSWLPTTALITFTMMNNFGVSTIPYVLVGELFPANVKEMASSLAILYGASLSFLVSKFFKPLSNHWGMYSMFWFFAGMCVCGSIFVYFAIPETKGKTLGEIQEELMGNKRRNDECDAVLS